VYNKRLIATIVSVFTLGVLFGIITREYDTFYFRALFVVLSVLSLVFIGVSVRKREKDIKCIYAVALAVAAFSFGVLRISLYNASEDKYSLINGETDKVLLEVKELDDKFIDVRVLESEIGVTKQTMIRFYPEELPNGLISGDVITADITYSFTKNETLYAKGISLISYGKIDSVNNGSGIIYSIRKSVSENSTVLYDEFEYAPAISKAVTVGDKSGLDSYIYSIYKTGGVSHVLAISGLHLSLITMQLYNFLVLLSVNRKASAIISAFVAVLYASLVGFTAGAIRAAVMMLFMLISRVFFKRADSITSLFVSLGILLIVNPYSLYSLSLQLSFLCSFGIILSEPMIKKINNYYLYKYRHLGGIRRRLYKLIPAVMTSFLISFVSSVFSFPVLCTSFDTISYISPLVNIIAVPLFSLAVGISLISFIFAPISLSFASVIAYPAGLIYDLMTDFIGMIYEADIGVFSSHSYWMIIPFSISVIMILSKIFLSPEKIKAFLCCALSFCISLFFCCFITKTSMNDRLIIEYNDSGVEYIYATSEEKNVYIDIGGYTSAPKTVFELGSTALDDYLMLRIDSYSFNRFDYFSGSMKINRLCMPNPKNNYERNVYLQIKELANQRNCDIITVDEVYSLNLYDNTQLQVLGYDSISNETLYCIDHNGTKLRILGNEYSNRIKCDTVIVLDGFSGDMYELEYNCGYASEDYMENNEYSEKLFAPFNEGIIIESEREESDFNVYEP